MVGIVVVSHSQRLAEGVVELAQMMAPDAPVAAAGGLDDGTTGTSFEKIIYAIRDVYTEEGAAILVDLGSAVLSAEMAVETLPECRLELLDCPLVEGAVLAAMESRAGASLETIVEKVQEARSMKKLQMEE